VPPSQLPMSLPAGNGIATQVPGRRYVAGESPTSARLRNLLGIFGLESLVGLDPHVFERRIAPRLREDLARQRAVRLLYYSNVDPRAPQITTDEDVARPSRARKLATKASTRHAPGPGS
jgi:hypothetical protein